ncbi:MAG: sugar phosphate nucleotidyltransferase [Bacteroidales bacterium]
MDKLIIHQSLPIQKALEILDESYTKTLFITDEAGILRGSLTDGDIRRWILSTGGVNGKVIQACNPHPFVMHHPADKSEALKIMEEKHLQAVPVVSPSGLIQTVITRDELSGSNREPATELSGIPVVIMAGGKGTRLDPITRILPKPLVPVGNQPVIELIMQEFARFGVTGFTISLNHQARLIKAYFEERQYPYDIRFLEEEQPLGTAGSLKLINGTIKGDLFVTNCDIIIRSDYNDILRFHRQGGFALTIVAALHRHAIPYGVCEASDTGHLLQITEKPEYSMLINAGMYVLQSDVLDLIPDKQEYHITHLIEALRSQGRPVGVFPVAESAYYDIGRWEAYQAALPLLTKGGI